MTAQATLASTTVDSAVFRVSSFSDVRLLRIGPSVTSTEGVMATARIRNRRARTQGARGGRGFSGMEVQTTTRIAEVKYEPRPERNIYDRTLPPTEFLDRSRMNRPSAPLEVREPAPPASPAETRRPSSSRIGELDALRGLAALAVVFHHLTRRFYEEYGRPPDSIPPFPISGNHGVFLFFIISGFVITQTLERTKRARDFVVSRFSRIYPSFWTAVLLTWGLVAVFGLPGREVTPVEALINLTMLQDHFFVRQVDYVYWSLTMEV